MTAPAVPAPWAHLPFFEEVWPSLSLRLGREGWLPGPDRVFRALDLTSPDQVRVVLIGQDPYPTPGDANGLAFSVDRDEGLPPSLSNILTELRADLGVTRTRGDLSDWARQGVLLMNTSLSVLPRSPGSHAGMRWDRLACQAVASAQESGPLAFVLWGAHARRAVGDLVRGEDLLVESAHPSPLSAHRGFFGSRPFSRVNAWLAERGEPKIVWA